MKKKVLVTGASGFVGRHCLEVLEARDYEIHAISRQNIKNSNTNRINWYNVDLFDEAGIEDIFKAIKPNYFIHLAWKMETGLNLNSEGNKEWFYLSKMLIRLFHQYGGERVFISGSGFEYDLDYKVLNENSTPLRPNNEYGKNKNKLNSFIKSYCENNDLSYVWGRIFFAFGPGQKDQSLIPYVISSLKSNSEINLTDGNQEYDYIYIKDVALAIVLLLESSYIGDINISSGKVIKLKDLIVKIARIFNKENLLNFGSLSRPKGSPNFVLGENELLKKVTSWTEKHGIDKGIKEFISYYKNQ